MITITSEDFLKYAGINLDIEVRGLDDDSNKVNRTIDLWTNRVYREANRNSAKPIPDDSLLNANQIKSIKDAICEYGTYYFKNGDLYRQSGYSEDKGQTISSKELDKIKFPRECIEILRQYGLIVRSIGRSYNRNQNLDGDY
jgi:hypothetical protein